MNSIVEQAIASVQKSPKSFCKFISANDSGKTKSHQAGFYLPKNAVTLFLDEHAVRGTNAEKLIKIIWQGGIVTTNSRFIYYGSKTRNEYRLTRFGKNFPFLQEDNVGDLFILSHIENEYYEAFVLSTDVDIEDFFAEFDLTASETNKLIEKTLTVDTEENLLRCFNAFNLQLNKTFPSTKSLSTTARECYNSSYRITKNFIKANPDKVLLKWLESEYQLFKTIELAVYSETIKTPFKSVEELVDIANTILNRRKSRAGKSLEYHLEEVFDNFELKFKSQATTEDNKKPDFIFPSDIEYHNQSYEADKLVFLAAKTTCKDRWRQIINEADRIKTKHLFTLQQGISKNQLNEMYKEGIKLVVPSAYLNKFPEEYKSKIFTLDNFINYTRSKQS